MLPDLTKPPATPPPNDALPLPAGGHPTHGLRHPSKFVFAAFSEQDKSRPPSLPNPLAQQYWDEWQKLNDKERRQQPVTSEEIERELDKRFDQSPSSSRHNSITSEDVRSWWQTREPSFFIEPTPWPPSTSDIASGNQDKAKNALLPLPPALPLSTARVYPDVNPDQDTVFYGARAEYYGGSNMEFMNSADLVPWKIVKQSTRTRGANKRTDSWMSGRGSKRHMVVFENKAEANNGADSETKRQRRDSDAED